MSAKQCLLAALCILVIFASGLLTARWLAPPASPPEEEPTARASRTPADRLEILKSRFQVSPADEAGLLEKFEAWNAEVRGIEAGSARQKLEAMKRHAPGMRDAIPEAERKAFDRMLRNAIRKQEAAFRRKHPESESP